MVKNQMKKVLHDVSSARPVSTDGPSLFRWLEDSVRAPVANNTHLLVQEFDPIEQLLSDHDKWPVGYPPHKKGANAVCFLHHRTNTHQSRSRFKSIFQMYVEHTLVTFKEVEQKYPHMRRYFTANPLGLEEYEFSDALIYQNASKLMKARALRSTTITSSASASALTPSVDDPEGADAASATAPSSASPLKIDLVGGESEDGQSVSVQSQSGAAAGTIYPMPAPVETAFSDQLRRLQRELYMFVRASIFRYMDSLASFETPSSSSNVIAG